MTTRPKRCCVPSCGRPAVAEVEAYLDGRRVWARPVCEWCLGLRPVYSFVERPLVADNDTT